jgi:hypothetical protein
MPCLLVLVLFGVAFACFVFAGTGAKDWIGLGMAWRNLTALEHAGQSLIYCVFFRVFGWQTLSKGLTCMLQRREVSPGHCKDNPVLGSRAAKPNTSKGNAKHHEQASKASRKNKQTRAK